MRSWTLAAWIMILVCAALALAHSARADGAEYLRATHLSMEAYKIGSYRDPYIPEYDTYSNDPEYWTHGAAVNMDLDIIRAAGWRWYWRNTVHESATNKQVRQVGWRWDLGIRFGDKIEIGHEHHSQHVLDKAGDGFYPNVDNYVVRFIFIP